MKILYVSPEHISGGFDLFVEGHRRRGNQSRYVTFFKNQFGFKEDLCFNLRLMPDRWWIEKSRRKIKKMHQVEDVTDLTGNPPYWKPLSASSAAFFRFRDWVNLPIVKTNIEKWGLNDYDVYHFEQGIDPIRNGWWIRQLAGMGKGIVSFYHGSDLRNRGVMRVVEKYSQLNLTSEIDLLERMPGMKYLFLPIDTDQLQPSFKEPDGRIKICHAARNRYFKGSDKIESVVLKLQKRYPIDWVMIENVNHSTALKMKAECDIFIDQITDAGGWGYGASSVEALSMGLVTMSKINPQVSAFLGDHPFVAVDSENLESELIVLLEDEALRNHCSTKGREWAVKTHGIDAVMTQLYACYQEVGFL